MRSSRRRFLQTAAATGAVLSTGSFTSAAAAESPKVTKSDLDRILDAPVLKTDFLAEPVTVASIELLRNGKQFLLRTRWTAGVEVITVPNSDRLSNIYPMLLNQIIPVFVNQDARKIESLLWDVYRSKDNYKYYGLAL